MKINRLKRNIKLLCCALESGDVKNIVVFGFLAMNELPSFFIQEFSFNSLEWSSEVVIKLTTLKKLSFYREFRLSRTPTKNGAALWLWMGKGRKLEIFTK
jgi:hypothetical protein